MELPLPTASASHSVHQAPLPAAARALTTLSRLDYHDCFLAEVDEVQERTAEEWARAVLEAAPAATRAALSSGWSALGLQRGPTDDPRLVLGWEVRRSTPDFALLGAHSALGLRGEVLFKRHHGELLFATFIHLENAAARGVWAATAPGHRQIVTRLLEQAARRVSASG
jgi:hypothetical protein